MSAISIGQAVVLGAVEGATEFLAVSSTVHLEITEGLMGLPVDDDAAIGFSAVIQVGASAAVLVWFRKGIARIASAWSRGLSDREPCSGADGQDVAAAAPQVRPGRLTTSRTESSSVTTRGPA